MSRLYEIAYVSTQGTHGMKRLTNYARIVIFLAQARCKESINRPGSAFRFFSFVCILGKQIYGQDDNHANHHPGNFRPAG